MADNVIEARGLLKLYGTQRAVDAIDLDIRRGEIFGLLGPNGAGKTTTILMMLGLTEISGGSVQVVGFNPVREPLEVKRRVGYLPDSVGFYDHLTARENLLYTARLLAIPRSQAGRRIMEAMESVKLADVADKRVATFSRGMRQRLGLAELLMKDAEIAILDEPTSGLDPLMEEVFRQCIEEERHRDRTVLLSSHILSEVEALCDRISIIRRGKVVETGTLADLRHLTRTSIQAELTASPNGLAQLPGVHGLDVEGNRVRCEVDTAQLDGLMKQLAASGIKSLVAQPPTLEELFLRHYEDDAASSEPEAALR